jgi:hypothetical protein
VAQKVQVLLTDDIDGNEADQTVRFGWLGADYEIDLSAKNVAAFEKAIAKYLDAGRKIRGGAKARGSAKAHSAKADLNAVRTWARDNGYEVSDRGRISAALMEAYDAAY